MLRKLLIAFHFLVIIAFFSGPKLWGKKPSQKIKFHFQKNHPQIIAKAPSQIKKVQAPVQKKIVQPPKSQTKQIAKKPIQKPKIEQKKPIPSNQTKETIAKIEEKIDKLEQMTKREIKQELQTESVVLQNSTESLFSDEDVALYLFQMLELPGPGKVTVELFLSESGKIETVNILSSENIHNSQYLMNALKDLILPFEKKEHIPSNLKVCFSNLQA